MMHVWSKDHPYGAELAHIRLGPDTLSARGVALGIEPYPYRLEYELTTVERFVTGRMSVQSRGDNWRRAIVLERTAYGVWSCTTEAEGVCELPTPGGDLSAVAGALDCDLGLSPLTNTMPVLRHRLHERGGPIDLVMAWISVPDLSVRVSRQRYTFLRREADARIVRFESLDVSFIAEISFDPDGLVRDYPGIARRVT